MQLEKHVSSHAFDISSTLAARCAGFFRSPAPMRSLTRCLVE